MKWQTVLVLVIVVIVYAILGGLIFSYLEKNNEQNKQQEFNTQLDQFLGEKHCVNLSDVVYLHSIFSSMFVGGLSFDDNDGSLVNGTRWDYYTSIFVAVELIGTIGYPTAAPKTTGGRIFTVFYAFIGIPLFILSAIGFSQLLNLAADMLLRLVARCRYGRRDSYDEETRMMDQVFGRRRRRLYRLAIIAILGIGLFVLIPSYLFTLIERWTYAEAAYYCFITLVTIGFGDFIPGYATKPNWLAYGWYRLAVACWLLIVVGWFAGTIAAVRQFIIQIVIRVEDDVIRLTDDVTEQRLPPRYTVESSGNTSLVSVTTNNKSRPFWTRWRKPNSSKMAAGDVTSVGIQSRGQSGVISSNAPSYLSTVKVGSQ